MTKSSTKKLRIKTKFDSYFSVDKDGIGGGLALFWCKEIKVTVCSFNKYHTNNIIKEDGSPHDALLDFIMNPKRKRCIGDNEQNKTGWKIGIGTHISST